MSELIHIKDNIDDKTGICGKAGNGQTKEEVRKNINYKENSMKDYCPTCWLSWLKWYTTKRGRNGS